MRTALPSLLVLVAGTASGTIAVSAESTGGKRSGPALTIEASASPLLIERGAAGRRQMTLPDIEIEATLRVRCSPGSVPTTASLMSADTRVAVSGLTDRETQTVTLALAIPAAQLPPVYTKDFCIERVSGPSTLVKPALVTLQGSLRCSARPGTSDTDNPGPEAPEVETPASTLPVDDFARASAAVDIELRCQPEPAEAHGADGETARASDVPLGLD